MKRNEALEGVKLERDRINITLPAWLRDKGTIYGARRGYGMSELITRLLEKWIEEEDERIAAAADTTQPLLAKLEEAKKAIRR